jgi:2-methylcitrate dehydratase PrpD
VHSRPGWHRTAAIGVFGATAAAGKLIGLTPEEMLAAFANASWTGR